MSQLPSNPSNHGLSDSLVIDIKTHKVSFVLPEGAVFKGTLELPCGAIICGTIEGTITCKTGSLILPKGSVLRGSAYAENIFVEGSVENPGENRISVLNAQMLIAISNLAKGRADLVAKAFNINSTAFDGRLMTLKT